MAASLCGAIFRWPGARHPASRKTEQSRSITMFSLGGFSGRDGALLSTIPPPPIDGNVNLKIVRSRAPCNGRLQTPPDPEGSNGSGLTRVPRITRGLAYKLDSPSLRMYQV